MKLSKEQLLSIGNLKLADVLDGSDGEWLENYCGLLSEFVEFFPAVEADFKKAVFIGDTEALARVLAELSETLSNIRADDLARECEKMRANVNDSDPEKLEADLIAFLSLVATLSVDIQMEQHKAAEAIKPKTRKYPVIYADRMKTVLAVDDIPVTLNILKTALQDAGYNFYGVTSGAAALDFVGKVTPDLFILDIEMPSMSGFDLAKKLRDAGQGAPIVFLTGNTTREYLLHAVKTGAAGFLVKPVNPAGILEKVKKALETAY